MEHPNVGITKVHSCDMKHAMVEIFAEPAKPEETAPNASVTYRRKRGRPAALDIAIKRSIDNQFALTRTHNYNLRRYTH